VSDPTLEDGAEAPLSRYEAIHEHAELELRLAGEGDIDRLPARPPAAAATLLQRAQLVHERTHIELIRLRESLLGEIATTTRARRVADGYAGQLPRRTRLDRTA
jgi:hypothetical protein